jgi:hypothetical protein
VTTDQPQVNILERVLEPLDVADPRAGASERIH